jgi:3-phosphoglycerate kinase
MPGALRDAAMIIDVQSLDSNRKTVLVRCDFNVPLKNGKIVDAR